MDAEIGWLEGSLAAVGCEDWLLPPATPEEIDAVVEAVAPYFVPSELIELWSRHAGLEAGRDWFLGWSTPARCLQVREWSLGNELFPGTWPYWNDDRWLPIAAADRTTFFVVLGEEPVARSVVGAHSSSALDVRVQQSSLRSWVRCLDLMAGALGDLEIDPRDEHLRPSGWWDTMSFHDGDPDSFPPLLVEAVGAGLPGLAAIDAALTWPEPTPFQVGTGDPLGGPWMQVLGVAPS